VYAAGSSFWRERAPGRDHDPGPDFVPGIVGRIHPVSLWFLARPIVGLRLVNPPRLQRG